MIPIMARLSIKYNIDIIFGIFYVSMIIFLSPQYNSIVYIIIIIIIEGLLWFISLTPILMENLDVIFNFKLSLFLLVSMS